jgi:DNA-binding IclR family transcriptional regulator
LRKPKQKAAAISRVLKSFADFEGHKQFATTLARGLEILRCFSPEGPTLGNKDLAARTGLPKPTISRFTYTLSRLGYLKTDHVSSKYQLGPAVLAIGYPLLATITLRQIARPAMKALADYAGGSVSMGIRDRLNIVYVETSRSTAMFSRQLSNIGLSQPIAKTAIGRAYLAACGAAEREAILNEIRIKTPQIWDSHGKKVQQSLSDYESFGFCTSWGDMRSDVHAVGVSLRLVSTGDIVAFNCALQSFLVTPEQIRSDIGPRLVAMVRGLAAA